MASRREHYQEEIRLRVLRLLDDNPEMSTREIAKLVGISNGSTYYCVRALMEKGMIKFENFKTSKHKGRYAYMITPKGLYEKAMLTTKFLSRKIQEYKSLEKEIKELENEIKVKNNTRSF